MTFQWMLLTTAAFAAGALNAVAGGGSFLTFPALVYIGVPAVSANATGAVALLPGYASSSYALRRGILSGDRFPLVEVLICLAGGLAGALLLLLTPNQAFRVIVPWLLLAATALFAFGPTIRNTLSNRDRHAPLLSHASLFAVSVYGGYFNGGLGIMLLAQLSLAGLTGFDRMNGLKNLFSSVLTAIAVTIYAMGGAVVWPLALGMAVSAVAGGYGGAIAARWIPPQVLRMIIVIIGLLMTAAFFLRG